MTVTIPEAPTEPVSRSRMLRASSGRTTHGARGDLGKVPRTGPARTISSSLSAVQIRSAPDRRLHSECRNRLRQSLRPRLSPRPPKTRARKTPTNHNLMRRLMAVAPDRAMNALCTRDPDPRGIPYSPSDSFILMGTRQRQIALRRREQARVAPRRQHPAHQAQPSSAVVHRLRCFRGSASGSFHSAAEMLSRSLKRMRSRPRMPLP